jgi:ankyrin repeat protein
MTDIKDKRDLVSVILIRACVIFLSFLIFPHSVLYLLGTEYDVDVKDSNGLTALMWASSYEIGRAHV